ncbi:Tetraspanin-36 [Triplophysa tibetana]|uniref:Tetraspanin n=1 Tax=Triplophysa tibetana TaxID=1572043 RepID=A0A5A9PEN5_9TELE|nr:Tetraspanin-36 [Triplophysa tibetana]
MDLTKKTLNIFIKTACLLILLFGIWICLGGLLLLLKYRYTGVFFSSCYIDLPVLLAVISGVLLLIGGSLGCVLSRIDSSCLQALFVYFLIVVCCSVSTAAALAYFHIGKLDVDLAPFKDVFQYYSGNSQDPDARAVDALQSELQCCGVTNYTDWMDTPWFNHSGKYEVPLSCCNKTFHICNGTINSPQLLYNEGCQIKFKDKLHLVLVVIMLTSFGVILTLIFSAISVRHLMKHHPPQEYQILDQE